MYCYHCGNKVYNEMGKCPFCGNKLERFEQNMFINTLADLADFCPDCNNRESMAFQIGDRQISISEKASINCAINRFVCTLKENICQKISEYMNKNDLGKILSKGASEIQSYMMDATYAMLAFLHKNGKLQVYYDEIAESKYGFIVGKVEFICKPIKDAEAEYKEKTREVRYAKAPKLERKSAWVGFGKGISGGIRAALTAKVMNTATDMLLDAGSTALSGLQKLSTAAVLTVEETKKIHSKYIIAVLKNSEEVFSQMRDFLYREIMGFEEQNRLRSSGVVYEKEEFMDEEKAFSRLEENPFLTSAYAYVYRFNRAYGMQLLKLAEYCGVEIEVLEKFIEIDACYLEEKQYMPDEINLDTKIDKVKEIQNEVMEMEKNNPAYRYFYPFTDTVCIKKIETERKIRKETDKILTIDRAEQNNTGYYDEIVQKAFEERVEKGKALEELLNRNNEYINDAVFSYLQAECWAAWKRGEKPRQFLDNYKGYLYPDIYDALIESWYQRCLILEKDIKGAEEYAAYIMDAAAAGRVRAGVYFAYRNDCTRTRWSIDYTVIGYLSEKRRRYYISKAAAKHCSFAWPMVGAWYEEGSNGYEKNSKIADIYAYNAVKMGSRNEWALKRVKDMEKMKVYN